MIADVKQLSLDEACQVVNKFEERLDIIEINGLQTPEEVCELVFEFGDLSAVFGYNAPILVWMYPKHELLKSRLSHILKGFVVNLSLQQGF